MAERKVVTKKAAVKLEKEVKVAKPAPKAVKSASVIEKKETTKPVTKTANLSIPVFTLSGNKAADLDLPKEVFGGKVNKQLLTQALRVYSNNQKKVLGHAKTRGEVEGSSVKIYRQKGTGRARHGSVRAPIFVGGGIVFGPRTRDVKLDLPKNMKKAALISALSSKLEDKNIVGVSGMEKASGKTKEISNLLKKMEVKNALIVVDGKIDNVFRGARNIAGVEVMPANLINAYTVLKHKMLIVTKEAVDALSKGKEAK